VQLRLSPAEEGAVGFQLAALGALDLSGRFLLEEGAPMVELEGHLRRLPLSGLFVELTQLGVELELAGDFVFAWRGNQPTAQATLSLLKFGVDEIWLSNLSQVRLTLLGGNLQIDPFILSGESGRFEAGGSLGETLDLSAKGQLDLAMLPPFLPSISKAKGLVALNLKVTGPFTAPSVIGGMDLLGPSTLRLRTAVREIKLTEASVEFTGSRAVIKALEGGVDSGRFSGTGEIDLSQKKLGGFKLSLLAQHLPLRLPDLAITLGAKLSAEGRWPQINLKGEIDLERGRYFRKFELKRFNFQAQEIDVDESFATTYPWLEGLNLDLHAVSRGGVEVVMNAGPFSLELALDSDLRIGGTGADPVITGQINSSRGSIAFPAATLMVNSARIDFEPHGADGIHPTLDLRAEGEVEPPLTGTEVTQPTYYVSAGLTGDPFLEMPLSLTSDPSLSQLEILSLLSTGRAMSSLGGSGAGLAGGDAAMALAGSQLVEPLTRFVTRQMEQTLNLDLQLNAAVTSAGVKVSAGKEISRRLRLEGSYQSAFLEVQSVALGRARFLLSDRLFLEYTGSSVSGQSSGTSALKEGSSSRLELKLRILGE